MIIIEERYIRLQVNYETKLIGFGNRFGPVVLRIHLPLLSSLHICYISKG